MTSFVVLEMYILYGSCLDPINIYCIPIKVPPFSKICNYNYLCTHHIPI